MHMGYYVQHARPLFSLAKLKASLRYGQRKLAISHQRRKDLRYPTFSRSLAPSLKELNRYLHPIPIYIIAPQASQIFALAEHYVNHRFDLLGSGWVQVKYGMNCRGLEGHHYEAGPLMPVDRQGRWLEGRINQANLEYAKHVWRFVDEGYEPIDWHLDFKSGFRWSENTWYLDVLHGHKLGLDIKVPWELSRMQHLPQLALAYFLAAAGHHRFRRPQTYAREFRNQVLDFVANNPPRFGVNWHYSMEVGVRITNWLVAYDLFRAFGADFDPEFKKAFIRTIYDHGLHIVNNLEWSEKPRTNHYLANIAGLLFVASYLLCTPELPELDAWLAFAVQELLIEVSKQFYDDGANYEASACYHRLSAEIVTYATAMVLALSEEKRSALRTYDHKLLGAHSRLIPAPLILYPMKGTERLAPFPRAYFERLERMAEFTMHITKPHGHIPQIGDNDNGRFLKLQSSFHQITTAEAKARYANLNGYSDLSDNAVYWDEDHLDHRDLVAAAGGLFEREDFALFAGKDPLETYLVKALIRNARLPSYRRSGEITAAEKVRIGTEEDLSKIQARIDSLPQESLHSMKISAGGGNLLKDLKLYAYPNFGLYIYRSERLFLALRCGPIGQGENGGHTHNDQLSLELTIDGKDLICDPGTYLYTPLPSRRNEYRSVSAHFTPQFSDLEPGSLDHGLFRISDEVKAVCLYFNEHAFIGVHFGYGKPIYRVVYLSEDALDIVDFTEGTKLLKPIYEILPDTVAAIPLSLGYGLRNA